jgi:hypothetical protein
MEQNLSAYSLLTRLQTALAAIPNVATCKIGLEATITPDDYPLIRIVPTRLRLTDNAQRIIDVTVYYGAALLSATDGLPAVYADLLAWETAIVEAVLFTVNRTSQAEGVYFQTRFIDTITDEDRLPHYKIFASRFEIEG